MSGCGALANPTLKAFFQRHSLLYNAAGENPDDEKIFPA